MRTVRDLARESADSYTPDVSDIDLESAIYWFCADHHSGQGSEMYRELSESPYRPSPMERGPQSFDARLIYNDLCDVAGCVHDRLNLRDA